MAKDNEKQTKKIPKLSKAKLKALELIRKEPDAPMIQIGNKLKDLGLIKKPERIYELTRTDKYNGYVCRTIEEIREKNFEMMSKEIVPEALKIHKRVLKNKKIPDESKKDWVSLAEKAEFNFDERKVPVAPVQVNIGQLQAIIRGKLSEGIE